MNECSWSSLPYLDLPYCDCQWWFLWLVRWVKQCPRSRTFLNSRRNFPAFFERMHERVICNRTMITWSTVQQSLTWHEVVDQRIYSAVSIAQPMRQQRENGEYFTLVVFRRISVDVECMHWKITHSKHYHDSDQHFWGFSSRFELSYGRWIGLAMAELLDFVCEGERNNEKVY